MKLKIFFNMRIYAYGIFLPQGKPRGQRKQHFRLEAPGGRK